MNSNRFKAVLFIVLFLLVVAIVVFIITSNNDEREYTPVSMQTTQPVEATPTPDVSTPYPTIHISDPTPTPVVTPTPAPTPEPTPSPTPTPEAQPAGTVLATGKFTSDSGTEGMLDIDANYNVTTLDNDNVQLTVSVDLRHFSLNTIGGARLHISAGENFVTVETPEISYDGEQGQMTTALGGYTFTISVPAGQSVSIPVQISWEFGGSYHGVDLDTINCGGSVVVAR